MKTTVELPDALLRSVKRHAAAHNMTLREVLEAGLRNVLEAEAARVRPFSLKRCTFHGKGLVQEESWNELRARIYEGRGA
ncbi:MAG: DUF2191 domain-containing protein [Candidatus Solibacter sp.]